MTRTTCSVAVIMVMFGLSATVLGQSFDDRLEQVRKQRMASRSATQQGAVGGALPIKTRMSSLIKNVDLDEVEGRRAFRWWSTTTGIPLVINWESLEVAGANPDIPINLKLNYIPSNRMLDLLLKQVAPDIETMYEITPWYVQVMTKEEANAKTVVKIYDVSDLLLHVPNFTGAPEMSLEDALDSGTRNGTGGTSGGGGRGGSSRGGGRGGGGGGGIFNTDNDSEEDEEEQFTRTERGENLVQMIRETIEPEIWQALGGEHASIRYYDGKLIVNAPLYVHRQIGTPIRSRRSGASSARSSGNYRPTSTRTTAGSAPRSNGEISSIIPSNR